MKRTYLNRGNMASERGASSSRMANRNKRSKFYDGVDSYSMGNAFTDPDPERYEVKTPDNFGEDPDMDTDWRRDITHGFDEESNFLLPLEQASPYNLSPKMAANKASACLKIAQQLFPEGTDEFVDVQAADLMHLPSQVVAATLVRMEQYNQEPAKVAAKMAAENPAPVVASTVKKAEEEAEEAPAEEKAEESPAEEPSSVAEQVEEVQTAVEELQQEFDTIVEEYADDMSDEMADEMEGVSEDIDELADMAEDLDADDLDSEMAAMDEEMADFDDAEASFDDSEFSIEDEEADAKLASAFFDDEADNAYVQKAARKMKAASNNKSNKNLRLSETLGRKVAKRSNAKDLLVDALWDNEPSVEDAFRI